MEQYNNDLYHWGIKGMKWGVRRYQNKDGSLTPAGRKRQMSNDAKETYALKKKKVNELSNAELRKLNERQNLERNYKQNNKSKIAIGLAATGTALTILGKVGSIEDNIGKIEKLTRRGKLYSIVLKTNKRRITWHCQIQPYQSIMACFAMP